MHPQLSEQTQALVLFLLARLQEDGKLAATAVDRPGRTGAAVPGLAGSVIYGKSPVTADRPTEVRADTQFVALYADLVARRDESAVTFQLARHLDLIARMKAAAWGGHPDYRPHEWRPGAPSPEFP